MTHSPSPWRRAGKNSGHIWAPDGDGVVQVAIVGAYSSRDMLPFNQERWDADAHLIAAAPEMLEVLQSLVRVDDNLSGQKRDDAMEDVIAAARSAIAKARGES